MSHASPCTNMITELSSYPFPCLGGPLVKYLPTHHYLQINTNFIYYMNKDRVIRVSLRSFLACNCISLSTLPPLFFIQFYSVRTFKSWNMGYLITLNLRLDIYLSGRVKCVISNGETKAILKEMRDVRKSSSFWNKFSREKNDQKLERLNQARQQIHGIS